MQQRFTRTSRPSVVAEVVAEADRWAAPELVAALAVDADDSDGVDDAVVAEPVIAKAVPFYKRELGFRRKQDGRAGGDGRRRRGRSCLRGRDLR